MTKEQEFGHYAFDLNHLYKLWLQLNSSSRYHIENERKWRKKELFF